jgi:hypothetical protein
LEFRSQPRERYNRLATNRSRYLSAARDAASLTLPHLIPDVDDPEPSHQRDIVLPFTGLGQLGVTTFAAKLTMALMPPGENSFRYQITEMERLKQQQALAEAGMPEEEVARQMANIDAGLLALEQSTLREIEAYNDRVRVFELVMHLLVAGNTLSYIGPDSMRVYHINQFVLRREPDGPPKEGIIKEKVFAMDLSPAIKEKLQREKPELLADVDATPDKTLDLYTQIEWGETQIHWRQVIDDVEVLVGTPSKIEEPEWIANRMFHVSGSDWSPGYIEGVCLADLQTANMLSQAITEGSLISARTIHGRKPNSSVKPGDFEKAKNGSTIEANPEDVFPIVTNKLNDYRVAAEELGRIEQRLRSAFMMLQIRNSERTTKQEVEATVMELQQSQGNVYSILTNEFQIPYIKRRLSLISGANKLPGSVGSLVKPVVNVGLAAVGRSVELEKYRAFLGVARENFGEQAIAQYVDPAFALRRMASSLNLLTPGLIKSDERIQQEGEQARADQLRNAALQAGAADPQKLASAAVTAQDAGFLSGPEDPSAEGMQPTNEQIQ